ncbi:TIGR04290 family methyltransferase [Roseococcus sp. SYP-B2431]|uniref:TIGR04290 family methyltransferase n=1 Tax=Roseococcus sp. SYP-B2431 TaxID=2496640 RepID=UPI00103972BA|nr:TIGR04290 family methyltransferase [Roseococcus sp. SYP-B2431]TCH98131.1 TIGR04290 family methyltransferase [Roseococcus sp. SYP-B2431]
MTPKELIRSRAEALGPWFHNIDLKGVPTAPDHPLGNHPGQFWDHFHHVLPQDMSGWSVLDIGCNGGFYSLEVKRRGAARVLGIDHDEDYLAQARFAARTLGQEIEFRNMTVYDVAQLGERFDLVIFMGVLYHLRHPLLALDLIHEHVADRLMLFQSMQRGSREIAPMAGDYPFEATEPFDLPGAPRLQFVEHRYAGDNTNWWIPNRACVEAMLRNTGFGILENPHSEVYLCRRATPAEGAGAVYPAGSARP